MKVVISCYNVDVHNAPHVSAVELLVHLLVAKRSSCVNEVLGEEYDIVLQHFKPGEMAATGFPGKLLSQ